MTTEPQTPDTGLPGRAYLAMALVAGTVLLYEVAITRVMSVILWYHFAFLSVSLAMLGLGAPGVWYSLRTPRPGSLRLALLGAGIAVPGSIIALFKLGYLLPVMGERFPSLGNLLHGAIVLSLVSVFVPLLALGAAVCLLLLQARGRAIGRMYGADLLGATAGALVVVPLMNVIPTPALIAGAGILPLLAAWLVCSPKPRMAPVIAVAIVLGMLWGEPFHLRHGKQYREPDDVLFEKWTPTARLVVLPNRYFNIFFGQDEDAGFVWGRGTKYDPAMQRMEQYWLEQDGSAGTAITELRGSPADMDFLLYDVTSVGYQVGTPRRACVIGAGGGRDILTALRAGVTAVDAVELNPHIIAALSGPFADFSGDVYHLPGVHAIASEGRSFLTRSTGAYDVLQISLIDSWAATAAGAYALSENYLYTREALQLYWKRLAPNGLISITRWSRGERQMESPRLALIAMAALEREGVPAPRDHVAIVQAGAMATLLVSETPWAGERLTQLRTACEQRGFDLQWPLAAGLPPNSLVTRILANGPAEYTERGYDLSPSADDRPFFFQTVPVFGRTDWMASDALSTNDHASVLLRLLLTIMTVLTVGLFAAPFLLARRLERHPGFWRGCGYFAAIGIAFMLVEAPWIQRFILYLGHPSYATTVVLATLLLGAGLGSIVASRVAGATVKRLGWLLPVVVVLLTLVLDPVFHATLGLPFTTRVGITLLGLAPTGFCMGFAFPTGMVQFGDGNKPWFWALNGAAGVLATVCSLALAMAIGFTQVALLGAACYVIAWLLLPGTAYPAADAPAA